MPRYIDADVILTKFGKTLQLAGNDGAIAALEFCKEIVQKAPTISPDEVRGAGEWIEKEVYNLEVTTIEQMQSASCSVCGKIHTTPFSYYFSKYNYCPNCGAKMEVSEDK